MVHHGAMPNANSTPPGQASSPSARELLAEEKRRADRAAITLKVDYRRLNSFFADDTDEIFCKVDRFNYERMGRKIVEEGKTGKSLYAIKGTVPPNFRMIQVKAVRYLGEME